MAVLLATLLLGTSGVAHGQGADRFRRFGTARDDAANDVVVDATGAQFVVGSTTGTLPGQTRREGGDAFLRKHARDGRLLFTRQFGTSGYDSARAVAINASGVYIAGTSSVSDSYPWLRKYSHGGALLFDRRFGTAGSDYATDVALDATGAVYLVGITTGTFPGQTNAGGEDLFLRKFTGAGTTVYTRQVGGTGREGGAAGVAVSKAGVFVVGTTYGTLPGQQRRGGSSDAFILGYSADGQPVFTRQFGTEGSDTASAVAADAVGAYVAGDSNRLGGGYQDAYLAKFLPDGQQEHASGVYIVGGVTPPGRYDDDPFAFVVRTTTSGEIMSERHFGLDGLEDLARGVSVACRPYTLSARQAPSTWALRAPTTTRSSPTSRACRYGEPDGVPRRTLGALGLDL